MNSYVVRNSLFRLLLPVFVLTLLVACSTGNLTPPACTGFNDITLSDIQSTTLSTNNIIGSNDSTNQIPAGTIIAYQTKNGRYGKFKVTTYGYTLVIDWVTYDLANDGTIYSQGTGLSIPGTFEVDLDEGTLSTTSIDLFWEIIDASAPSPKDAVLVPENGAQFAIYSSCGG